MSRIFISYSRVDEAFARDLYNDLEQLGADVWIDVEDIRAGLSWADSIQEGLEACDVMIVIITPESMASKNVADEWQYYINQDRPVIPVLRRKARVHFQLHRLQYIDFLNQDYDTAFAQLHSELRRKGIRLDRLSARDEIVQIPQQAPLPERDAGGLPRAYWGVGAVVAALIVMAIILALSGAFGGGDDSGDGGGDDISEALDPDAIASTVIALNSTQTAQAWTPTPTDPPTLTPDITQTIRAAMERQYTQTAQALAELPTATQTPEPTTPPTGTPAPTATPTDTPMPTAAATVPADPLEAALERARNFSGGNDDWEPVIEDFDGVEMVLVPAGSFEMGSTEDEIDLGLELCQQAANAEGNCQRSWYEDEAPTSAQRFTEPFWIDKYEVTRAQYQECVDAGECEETPSSDFSTEPNQPINRVTWFQAQAYCTWRNGRLPTEAEWEYAARGPDRLIFPWGDTFDGTLANHCDSNCGASDWASGYNYVNEENDDGFAVTAPVGSYPGGASWVGALDMSGNVWEWVSSIYKAYPYDENDGREDNSVTNNSRVLRGGSWFNSSDDLRGANRLLRSPDDSLSLFGFRCARSAFQ